MRGRLKSIRVKNFKAVSDSGALKLTPLTVFIGNNGSGKSSILEALQTLQRLVTIGLDAAMQVFKGMEHVKHKAVTIQANRPPDSEESVALHPMQFSLSGVTIPAPGSRIERTNFRSLTRLNTTASRYFVEIDEVIRSIDGPERRPTISRTRTSANELERHLGPFITRWQFLALDPSRMGDAVATRRTGGQFLLDPSGANLSDYLWHLIDDYGERGTEAWNGIVEALRFVLPYASAAKPTMTTELERRSLVVLQERFGKEGQQRFEIPAWMLSTGTMRVLALLAVLRHPEPPPVICIEELENGLDPRTLQLVVNEIQMLTESKRSQFLITTHSSYLLDLLPLSSIVMTQRTASGVSFTRPADAKEVQNWADSFAPGQLYLMGRLDAKERS